MTPAMQFIVSVLVFFAVVILYTRIRWRRPKKKALTQYMAELREVNSKVPYIPEKENYTVDEIIVFLSFPYLYKDRYDPSLVDMVLNELYDEAQHAAIRAAINEPPRTACGILILGKYVIRQTFPFQRPEWEDQDEIQANWQKWMAVAKEDYRDVLGQFPMGFKDRVEALRGVYGDDLVEYIE